MDALVRVRGPRVRSRAAYVAVENKVRTRLALKHTPLPYSHSNTCAPPSADCGSVADYRAAQPRVSRAAARPASSPRQSATVLLVVLVLHSRVPIVSVPRVVGAAVGPLRRRCNHGLRVGAAVHAEPLVQPSVGCGCRCSRVLRVVCACVRASVRAS